MSKYSVSFFTGGDAFFLPESSPKPAYAYKNNILEERIELRDRHLRIFENSPNDSLKSPNTLPIEERIAYAIASGLSLYISIFFI